ncbi:MAG TPA: class I poly(R)-hydroxyalkanoic acid synthase, partial [Hyphomicrobium sp.]|nr:class I poly(R)-hydroxyalkanoic acid synthase [Hyphomicrobium sp.]
MTKPAPDPATPYRIKDPEEFARNMMRVFEEGGRAMNELLERPDAKISPFSAASEATLAVGTLADIARVWLTDPAKLAEAQGSLVGSYIDLWNNSIRRMMGETVSPVAEPESSDNRFKDPEWSSNPYFDFWKQAYLLTTSWAEDVL